MSGVFPAEARLTARVNIPVFAGASVLTGVFVLFLLLFPERSGLLMEEIRLLVCKTFGWYYMLVAATCLFFVLWLACSRFGGLRLGRDGEEPEFGFFSWSGMLFSSGIGVSLLYFAVSEPVDHFLRPPEGMPSTPQAARQAMQLTFLHWGLHGWAMYALVGIAVGYGVWRHRYPLALRTALIPVLGEARSNGWGGHLLDAFGILVTIPGLVTNLIIGAMLVASGSGYLLGMDPSRTMLTTIVLLMSGCAAFIAVVGVRRGISRVSNLNVVLFLVLLGLVLLHGDVAMILGRFVQNMGDYLDGLLLKTFDLYAYAEPVEGYGDDGWVGRWTVFFWAWWMSWAPFVGLFIARISRGRTVREVVLGVLSIPLICTFAFHAVLGNMALDLVMSGADGLASVALKQADMSLYVFLQHYPFSGPMIFFAVVTCFVLFLTPAESGAIMLADLSRLGGQIGRDASMWLRLFWSLVVTLVALGLLFAGDFVAMQATVVLAALPFSCVLFLFLVGLMRWMQDDPDGVARGES
ncbi:MULTISPECIES: BCCT family transporter [unclassified Haematospirillum]|uniref:BCCT family transporter n=1 Tax=unclassified Haematospirillum TaxID=2622088 RepID=UPI0014392D0E|nr:MULTISPECIES: BCCT family transporter [unclassified Haematospirillum]NKD55894.1 BCCT family transporter [Haematospirillum sp. H4890]NKD75954.1 BCCT family transporter [Haematospirillum sp. H4485]